MITTNKPERAPDEKGKPLKMISTGPPPLDVDKRPKGSLYNVQPKEFFPLPDPNKRVPGKMGLTTSDLREDMHGRIIRDEKNRPMLRKAKQVVQPAKEEKRRPGRPKRKK